MVYFGGKKLMLVLCPTIIGVFILVFLFFFVRHFNTNEISLNRLQEKYEQSEVKGKYQLKGVELVGVIKNDSGDKVTVKVGDNSNFNESRFFLASELGALERQEFTPTLELSKWNEVGLKIIPDLEDVSSKDMDVSFQGDKIEFTTPKISFEMYEATDTDSYKYIWYLNEKPESNVMTFNIETEGLDFYYQPALTEEYQNGWSDEFQTNITVSETQVIGENGNILVERPENVVGSYAVYSSEEKINYINGESYKTGKVFHIYRPHIIDADGNETWGILSIDKDAETYLVEIPQEFLDKAVYPLKSNDTFGYTSAGASQTSAGGIWGSYSTPTEGTDATKMTVYNRNPDAYSHPTSAGIYDSSGNIVRESQQVNLSGGSSAAWRDYTFASAISTITNQQYKLGFYSYFAEYDDSYIYYDTAPAGSGFLKNNYDSSYPFFPSTCTDETSYTYLFSIYVTYTASISIVAPTAMTDSATSVSTSTATLNGTLSDDGGEDSSVRFQYGLTDEYTASTTWQEGKQTDDTFSETISGLEQGTLYHFHAQAQNSGGTSDGSDQIFLTEPSAPTDFSVSVVSGTEINLSWTKGDGADKTLIQMSTDGYPASTTDGIQVYFDTGTNTSATELAPGTTYYFSAWSEITIGELTQYSSNYSTSSVSTYGPPTAQTNDATNIGTFTAELNGQVVSDGGESNQYQFQYGLTSSYDSTTTLTGSVDTGGTFFEILADFLPGVIYHFRAVLHSSGGYGYGEDKLFLTKPQAPQNVSLVKVDDNQIDISWIKGDGADKTLIRRSAERYPASITDGTQVYFDTGTSYSDTGLDSKSTYYYSLWSEVTAEILQQYSATYVQSYLSLKTNAAHSGEVSYQPFPIDDITETIVTDKTIISTTTTPTTTIGATITATSSLEVTSTHTVSTTNAELQQSIISQILALLNQLKSWLTEINSVANR
jgi:hypothetical protein